MIQFKHLAPIILLLLTHCMVDESDTSDNGLHEKTPIITVSEAIEASECQKYDRDLYYHWNSQFNSIHGCSNTREHVLNNSNLNGISDNCNISLGSWYDPYSDSVFTDASELDIDHIVPLAEIHQSGGWDLSSDTKEDIANFMKNLIPVSASVNRSKGAKDPSEWLPPNQDYHTTYIQKWIEVKNLFELTADSLELLAIYDVLVQDSLVGQGEVPPLGHIMLCELETDPQMIDPLVIDENCGDKSTCSQMNSCEEALFYLNNCGLSGLDGNDDGVPCQSICS